MSDDQIVKGFEAMGWSPRMADIMMVKLTGANVEGLAEYIWDHILGEPDHPSLEQVESAIRKAVS